MQMQHQRVEPGRIADGEYATKPKVSIIIPVLNNLALTQDCLVSIQKNTPHDLIEVIIVDNASTDGTHEFLSALKAPYPIHVIRNAKNKGFAEANNQGALVARGKYLLLLNNDILAQPQWLPPLLSVYENCANVGAVGAKLLYPDSTIQHAGVVTVVDEVNNLPLVPMHFGYKKSDSQGFNKLRRFPAVTGACMLVTKSLYRKVGGLDEVYWNGMEDIDFCFKILEEGYDIYFQPESVLTHYESQSGEERYIRKNENFIELTRRWKDRITCQLVSKEKNLLTPNDGVTIVIVTDNSKDTIGTCLKKLEMSLRRHDEVVIIDNASKDQTQSIVRQYITGKCHYHFIVNEKNYGYAHSANIGANSGSNPYIVFLHPDTFVTAQWIDHLLFHFKPHIVAAVGPLSSKEKEFQKETLISDKKESRDVVATAEHQEISEKNYSRRDTVKFLMGFCLMVKRKVFDYIGGFDNAFFIHNADMDLSWRIRQAGYQLVLAKDTQLDHKGDVRFAAESKMFNECSAQENTDYLYCKLLRHYGKSKMPSALDLWGGDWVKPSTVFKEDHPLTSIIMLTYNQMAYTRLCIQSVFKHTHSPFELIVVDNGSTDGTLEYLGTLERKHTACIRIRIIANRQNNGFAGGCNQGLAIASGDYLLLLNNDVVVTSGWLSRLSQALKSPRIGFCGPMSNCVAGRQLVNDVPYDVNTLEGLDRFSDHYAQRYKGQTINYWQLVGFCMLIKRSVINQIGGLDERFEIGNFEDDDFCLRASLCGYAGAIVNDCFIHHFGSRSFLGNHIDSNDSINKNWETFKKKWGISPDTPYTRQYHMPAPVEGFDRTKHYVSINSAQWYSMDNAVDTSAGQRRTKNNINVMVKQTDPKHPKDGSPGGVSMQILDKILDVVRAPFFSEKSDVAMWILERLVEEVPDHGGAQHELGMLYYEQNQLAKAQAHLNRAARFCPENPAIFRDLGDFYHVVHKDNSKAIKMYEKAIEISPPDGQLLLTVAHLCTAEKLFDRAMEYYQLVLENEPGNQEAQICLDKLKKRYESNVRSDTVDTLYTMAQSSLEVGDRDGAIKILNEILEKAPDHALAHNDCAVLAYEKKDMEKALHHYEKAVSLDHENLVFIKNLADFYWWEQRNEKAAMKLYVQILSKDPADVETILSCGQICMELERYDDARDFVDRARAIDPFDENANLLNRQVEDLRTYKAQHGCDNGSHQKANQLAAVGDLAGAINVLTEKVQENRDDADAFNSLGVLYYELGQKEKALSCYREAVKIKPKQEAYSKNLADFYFIEQGRTEDAMKLYLSVLKDNPKDVDCLMAIGIICMTHEKIDDARGFFEQVRHLDPENKDALMALQKLNITQPINADTGNEMSANSQGEKRKAFG